MFRCPGCRSNTHKTHTIRLDTEQKVVAPDALHSRLLKHTSIRIEIHKDILYNLMIFNPMKKFYVDFLFWLLLLPPFFSSFFFLNRLHSCLWPPVFQCAR